MTSENKTAPLYDGWPLDAEIWRQEIDQQNQQSIWEKNQEKIQAAYDAAVAVFERAFAASAGERQKEADDIRKAKEDHERRDDNWVKAHLPEAADFVRALHKEASGWKEGSYPWSVPPELAEAIKKYGDYSPKKQYVSPVLPLHKITPRKKTTRTVSGEVEVVRHFSTDQDGRLCVSDRAGMTEYSARDVSEQMREKQDFMLSGLSGEDRGDFKKQYDEILKKNIEENSIIFGKHFDETARAALEYLPGRLLKFSRPVFTPQPTNEKAALVKPEPPKDDGGPRGMRLPPASLLCKACPEAFWRVERVPEELRAKDGSTVRANYARSELICTCKLLFNRETWAPDMGDGTTYCNQRLTAIEKALAKQEDEQVVSTLERAIAGKRDEVSPAWQA